MTPTDAESALLALGPSQVSAAIFQMSARTPDVVYTSPDFETTLMGNLSARGLTSGQVRSIRSAITVVIAGLIAEDKQEGTVEFVHDTAGVTTGRWIFTIDADKVSAEPSPDCRAAMSALSAVDDDEMALLIDRLIASTSITAISGIGRFWAKDGITNGLVMLAGVLKDLMRPGEEMKLGMLMSEPGGEAALLLRLRVRRAPAEAEK